MRPIRLPVATNKLEETGTKGIGASPKFLPYLYEGGDGRRSSIRTQSLGCLSLLDAAKQVERPRATPSPGLEGEEPIPTEVKILALPTIHIHRPRAVLSSPENDDLICELQAQQEGPALTAPLTISVEDLSMAPVSPSKEVPKAIASPPDVFFGSTGDGHTSLSEDGPSCSSSSNGELMDGLLPAVETLSELVVDDIKQDKVISSTGTKEKLSGHRIPLSGKNQRNGSQENLSGTNTGNRTGKKVPSGSSHRPLKQHLPKPVSKGNTTRILRPWY